jgi:DNA-binding transcriptional ArsR family regulator
VITAAATPTETLGAEDGGGAPAPGEKLPRLTPFDLLTRVRLIVHTLADEPGLTSRELAERNGLTRRNMSLLLLRLEEHGLVVRQGRRWFPGPEAVE